MPEVKDPNILAQLNGQQPVQQPAQQQVPQAGPPPFIPGTPKPPARPAAQTPDQAEKDRLDVIKAQQAITEKQRELNAGDQAKAIEAERKAAAFLIRGLGANEAYEGTGVGAPSLIGQTARDIAPNISNYFTDESRQTANSAQDEFIAASLRQDSGAAIPEEELERQRRIYFPMPGDGPEVIEQKRQARLRALEGLKQSAGRLEQSAEQRYNALMASIEEGSPGARKKDDKAAAIRMPEMVGGLPKGTDIEFGMDKGSSGGFNREAWLREYAGYGPNEEANLIAILNANRGNADITAQDVAEIYRRAGIEGTPSQSSLEDIANKLHDDKYNWVPNDDTLAESAYDLSVSSEARRLNESIGDATLGDLTQQGAMFGLGDEATGIGTAIGGLLRGDAALVTNYQRGRDAEQLRLEQARERYGMVGTGAEMLGGIGSGGNVMSGSALRGATTGGAMAGYGYGEGTAGSLGGAAIGGSLGAGTYAGMNALAPRLANIVGPSRLSTEQRAALEAADRRQVPMRNSEIFPENAAQAGEVARSPGGKPIFDAAAQEDVSAIEAAIMRDVGGKGTAVERETMGRTVRGAMNRNLKTSSAAIEKTYKRVDKLAPKFTAGGPQTIAVIDAQIAQAESKGLSDQASVLKDLRGFVSQGGLSVDRIQGLRQKVRDIVGRMGLAPGSLDRAVTIVQKTAGDELVANMEARGLKGAADLLNQANSMNRAKHELVDQTLTDLLGPADKPFGGQKIADKIKNWAQSDVTRLKTVFNSMNPAEQGEVRNTIAASLGKDSSGNFSFAQFMRSVVGEPGTKAQISPEAQRVLFGPDGMRAIQDLRLIVSTKQNALKQGMAGGPTQGAVNKLGKGLRTSIFMLIGGGLGAKIGGTEGALIGGTAAAGASKFFNQLGERRAARLFTNPDFTKWLRNMPQATAPNAINKYFEVLTKTASRSPVFAADVKALQQALMDAFQQSPMRAAAEGQQGDASGNAGDNFPTKPIVPGNLPLGIRYKVQNPDGSVSTVRTMSIGTDKGEVLIPTVINGKVVSDEEAIRHYEATGENFGTFRTPEEATAYAQALHRMHERALSMGDQPQGQQENNSGQVPPQQ